MFLLLLLSNLRSPNLTSSFFSTLLGYNPERVLSGGTRLSLDLLPIQVLEHILASAEDACLISVVLFLKRLDYAGEATLMICPFNWALIFSVSLLLRELGVAA